MFSGYGLNCEEETKFAFELAGAKCDIIHINDLIEGFHSLSNYQILAFPGGFSFGDDTGSGNAFAHRIKNSLWEQLLKRLNRDILMIGICNGFQILVNLGVLPALDNKYGEREVALLHNDSARYTIRWVDGKVDNQSSWTLGLKKLFLPIAHGEGKFYSPGNILSLLRKRKLIALKYTKGEIIQHQNLAVNPTGTLENIAAITDETGRIFGIMPHPERAIFFTQLPHWTYLKEKYLRAGKKVPQFGPGLQIFQNAVNYFL